MFNPPRNSLLVAATFRKGLRLLRDISYDFAFFIFEIVVDKTR